MFGYSIIQILWYFIIYSFLGWVLEVVYCTIKNKKVINRGFLNGPVCPIYGFGMVAILFLLKSINPDVSQVNPFILFFGGMILSTIIELVGGWALMKCFHTRWWDYSMRPYNFHGYICLQFSIAWGFGSIFAVKCLHSTVSLIMEWLIGQNVASIVLVVMLLGVYAFDVLVTVSIVVGMNKRLERLNEIQSSMKSVSNSMSQTIGTKALEANEKKEEVEQEFNQTKEEWQQAANEARDVMVQLAEARKNEVMTETEEWKQKTLKTREVLQQKYDQQKDELIMRMQKHNVFGFKRLLKAFPSMSSDQYDAFIKELMEEFNVR